MITNYFRIAWRNLRRNRTYTLINIVGLSLGIACSILIYTLINYHLGFDGFHPDKDRIYRIVTEFHQETTDYTPAAPQPLGKAFRQDFSFAENTARVIVWRENLITIPGGQEPKKFQEGSNVAYAEPDFFSIFHFPLAAGGPFSTLDRPNTALITEKIAKKYFGDGPAIGKTIRVDNQSDYTITGILKDIPANTTRNQEIYLSYANLKDKDDYLASDKSWGGVYSGCQCFVKLRPGVRPQTVDQALIGLSAKYYDAKEAKENVFHLQPLSDIHFNPQFDGPIDRKYLWVLGCIGLFLIVTACVNFINLATAQSLNRSKEVGIRKVLGSLRSQLFWQFIAETALLTLVALFIAWGIATAGLQQMNKLANTHIPLQFWDNGRFPLFLAGISVLVIFLAGSYPGLVLARFQPVLALKSKLSQAHIGGFSLRRILVVTQFAICQILIIGAIVIAWQMHYSQSLDMGFSKKAIVTLPLPKNDKTKMNTLRDRLAAISGVDKISLCYQPPASRSNRSTDLHYDNRANAEPWAINMKAGDDQYIATFGIKLVAGRNFYPSDSTREFLVNEAFVKKMNLPSPNDILGKSLSVNGGTINGHIVGVVRDFHQYSLHEDISPLCIMPNYELYSNISIRLGRTGFHEALAGFEKTWNSIYPEYLYSANFLDDSIADFYKADHSMLTLIGIFAGIAILIGCMGLYGLVSFMAVRKTKEIGVRRVLGANTPQILWLFGKELTRLLFIAFAFAAPIGWYAMHKYLENFKYRIPIGAGIFVLAIGATFVFAAITVGYRSARAALANPVKSLRSE